MALALPVSSGRPPAKFGRRTGSWLDLLPFGMSQTSTRKTFPYFVETFRQDLSLSLPCRHIWTPPFMQARFTQWPGPGLRSYIRLREGTFMPGSEP